MIVVAAVIHILTAALHSAGKRKLCSWLLMLFLAIGCGAACLDLLHGTRVIGEAVFESDTKPLAFLSTLLLLRLVAALRSNCRWILWLAPAGNATVRGILIYFAFFWRAFS